MRSMAIVVLAAFFVQDTWADSWLTGFVEYEGRCLNDNGIAEYDQDNDYEEYDGYGSYTSTTECWDWCALRTNEDGEDLNWPSYVACEFESTNEYCHIYGEATIVGGDGEPGVTCLAPGQRQDDTPTDVAQAPTDSPADMCAEKINEEMRVIEETLTRCAEEGHSGPAFDYCVLGICGTEFTAGYTVCQQSRFWRMARDCDSRVCVVDLRKFWLTTPTPNGYQLPTGNGNGNWKWVPYQGGY